MKIEDAVKYITEIPHNKKNHDSWMELWRKDSRFRYAACIVLEAVWDGRINKKGINLINAIEADINDLRTNNADRNKALNDVLDVIKERLTR